MKPYTAICSFVFLLITCTVYGQEQGKNLWEKGKETSGKSKGKIKTWKTHLNSSPTDSIYKSSFALSGKLHTNGWTAGIVYQHKMEDKIKSLWQLQFSEIRHEKELKQERNGFSYNDYGVTLRPYFYGKINHAYILQFGYGREQMLFPAILDGNLSVSLRYSGGVSLAMMKPIYLHLLYTQVIDTNIIRVIKTEKYSEINSEMYLNHNLIVSRDKWKRGLREMRYIPGIFAEASIGMEPEWTRGLVQRFNVGGQVALFANPLELMANQRANRIQASLFVSLDIGKRW